MIKLFSPLKSIVFFAAFFLTATLFPKAFAVPSIDDIEAATGYRFKSASLLAKVFRHPSRHPDNQKDFGRLMFRGDTALNHAVSVYLLEAFPDHKKRDLTLKRSGIASNAQINQAFERLDLVQYIESQGIRERKKRTVNTNTGKALIGAIDEDGGSDAAREFILSKWRVSAEGDTCSDVAEAALPGLAPQAVRAPSQARHLLHLREVVLKKGFVQYKVAPHGSEFRARLYVNRVEHPGEFIGTDEDEARSLAAADFLSRDPSTEPFEAASITGSAAGPSKKKTVQRREFIVTISFQGYTGTFRAASKHNAKQLAARAAYRAIVCRTVSTPEAMKTLHHHCQLNGLSFPKYKFE